MTAAASAPAPRSRGLYLRARTAFFWLHLTAGCAAGLVVLMMAVTGVLLTYERQIMASYERASWADHGADAASLAYAELLDQVRSEHFEPKEIVVRADPRAPVGFAAGRRERVSLDAVDGEVVPPAAPEVDEFFTVVMRVHRWFALEGDARDVGRDVTGLANLAFLFLLGSGLFIWLPRVWSAAMLRTQLLFTRRPPTAKARDYNWHHVIGFWCLVPLIAIAASATVFHYDWATDALRSLSGAGPAQASAEPPDPVAEAPLLTNARDIDTLISDARLAAGEFERLTITLPAPEAAAMDVVVDRGNGAQVQHQAVLRIDRRTGASLGEAPRFEDDPYRWARFFNRFLHTGEVYGVFGQAIAGLASLGCAVLAWTGLALAWRRLVLMPLRRRARRRSAAGSAVPAEA